MALEEIVLLKRGCRTDRLWTMWLVYKSFLRYVPLYLDTSALMKSQYWSRARIEHLRDERLRQLFSEVAHLPFWKGRIGVAGEGEPLVRLAQMPIVSKKELIDADPKDVVDERYVVRSDTDHTSGSTGRPFHFRFDWGASLRSFAVTERTFRTATHGQRYPIVYMRARPRNGFTFYKHTWFFLKGFRSVQHRMEELKKIAGRLKKGFVLYGYTSSLVEVARQMELRAITLPIKAAMAAGEDLRVSDRVYVERVMGCEVFTLYASREAGFLAYECENKRLHINEEWAYIEIVNEDGLSLENGKEGKVIVTTFDNRVMPFIRYDIGDRGVISKDRCPCGRTLSTIALKGRSAELIELADARVVSLLDVSAMMDVYWKAIRQFQIIQKGPLEFTCKVVPGTDFDNARNDLNAGLVRLLHPNVQITWEKVEAIAEAKSGKAVYFIRDFGPTT